MASMTAGCEHRLAVTHHHSFRNQAGMTSFFLRLYLKAKKQQIIFYLFVFFIASFGLGAIFIFLHKFDAAAAFGAVLLAARHLRWPVSYADWGYPGAVARARIQLSIFLYSFWITRQ
ncbi:hypothetical protein [Herbaspirillum seropedicae]|uniref:hypothetical protein n=1 Tax=Herbaspirillum seropedicae TaxID=964 RepID=UPI003D9892DE